MASHQQPRAASIAERRASASIRQHRSRPTSAVPPTTDETRSDSRATTNSRKFSTTTETTKRETSTRETLIRRTLSPTKQANGRKSTETERPPAKEKATVRREPDNASMYPVHSRHLKDQFQKY